MATQVWKGEIHRCGDCGTMFNRLNTKTGQAECPTCLLREQLGVPNEKTKGAIEGARRGEVDRIPPGGDPLADLDGGGS